MIGRMTSLAPGLPPGTAVRIIASGVRGEIVGRYGTTDAYCIRVRDDTAATMCLRMQRREITDMTAAACISRQDAACDDVVHALMGLRAAYAGSAADAGRVGLALVSPDAGARIVLADLHAAAARIGLDPGAILLMETER